MAGTMNADTHAGHAHDGHAHGAGPGADPRKLAVAGALIVVFMCGEVPAGLAGHSLALLSDAAHMLIDAASIALALMAPQPVAGGLMLGVALAGVCVNLAATWLLDRARRAPGQRRTLNTEGAFAHILTDLY